MAKADIFEEYALIDSQIAEMELKKASLRTKILERLVKDGVEKLKTALGTFTMSPVKKWTYPDVVQEKTEEVKALKAKFESTGEATYTETPSFRFTGVKL